MEEIEIQIAGYIGNIINIKGIDVLNNSIGLFGLICDNFISYPDVLLEIKPAAITTVSKELKEQMEANQFDCKKLFNQYKSSCNQEALNKYLKILFRAIGRDDRFEYSPIEVISTNENVVEKKVVLEKSNDKIKTANDYYELAKAQKTIRGIENQDIYIDNLMKAVEMGHCDAIHTMAHYYIKGKFVPLDVNRGISLLKEIADKGDIKAAYDLYNLSKRNLLTFEEAFPYLKVAANGGMQNVFYELGMVYYENGSPEDYSNAVNWFEKACEYNDMHAYYQLALCYRFGHGVIADAKRAMELLNKAAELGHYKAKEIIGG